MNAQGRLKPSSTLSAAAATACFHDLLKKNTTRTGCCRYKDNITGARCSVEKGAASSWLLSEPPEHHAHCASACVRNKQNATKSEVREEEERGRAGQGRAGRRDIQRRKLTPIQKLTPMYSGWVSFSTSECMLEYYGLFCLRTCNMDEAIDHTHGCNLILNLNGVNFPSPTRIHGWNWSNIDKFGNEGSSKMASNHIIG